MLSHPTPVIPTPVIPTTLSVPKLKVDYFFVNHPVWDRDIETPIKLEEVLSAVSGKDIQAVKVKSFSLSDSKGSRRAYHIRRIAWFVLQDILHPITVRIPTGALQPRTRTRTPSSEPWPFKDGNHRLQAAMVKGQETIGTVFEGTEGSSHHKHRVDEFIRRYGVYGA